jgi:hypothetical protein
MEHGGKMEHGDKIFQSSGDKNTMDKMSSRCVSVYRGTGLRAHSLVIKNCSEIIKISLDS